MSFIKVIWEFLKNSPAIIGLINEIVKVIKDIVGNKDDTKEQLKVVRKQVSDLRNPRL